MIQWGKVVWFGTRFHCVDQADLNRMILFLSFPNAGITGVSHQSASVFTCLFLNLCYHHGHSVGLRPFSQLVEKLSFYKWYPLIID